MVTEISTTGLSGISMAPDGTNICLQLTDERGSLIAVKLPIEILQSLILSLPHAAAKALRLRYRDDTLRIVYPALSTVVERSTDPAIFIVTFVTPDSFEISFGLSAEQGASINERIQQQDEEGDRPTSN